MYTKTIDVEQEILAVVAMEFRQEMDQEILSRMKHIVKSQELESDGWIKVTIKPGTNLLDLNEWVFENLSGEWYIHDNDIWFELQEDATISALRWA